MLLHAPRDCGPRAATCLLRLWNLAGSAANRGDSFTLQARLGGLWTSTQQTSCADWERTQGKDWPSVMTHSCFPPLVCEASFRSVCLWPVLDVVL